MVVLSHVLRHLSVQTASFSQDHHQESQYPEKRYTNSENSPTESKREKKIRNKKKEKNQRKEQRERSVNLPIPELRSPSAVNHRELRRLHRRKPPTPPSRTKQNNKQNPKSPQPLNTTHHHRREPYPPNHHHRRREHPHHYHRENEAKTPQIRRRSRVLRHLLSPSLLLSPSPPFSFSLTIASRLPPLSLFAPPPCSLLSLVASFSLFKSHSVAFSRSHPLPPSHPRVLFISVAPSRFWKTPFLSLRRVISLSNSPSLSRSGSAHSLSSVSDLSLSSRSLLSLSF